MGNICTSLLVAAWAIFACVGPAGGGSPASTTGRVFTAVDNGKRKSVRSGDKFSVSLEASAGSGFRWHLLPLDTAVIKPLGRQTQKPASEEPGFVGGTYQDLWRFEAVNSGQVNLQFDLFPPWENRQAATQTVVLTIIVHP